MQLQKPSLLMPLPQKERPSAAISEIQLTENNFQEYANQVSKLPLSAIPLIYPSLLNEIKALNLKPLNVSSRVYKDFTNIMNLLTNYPELNTQDFINLNYLLVFYLEFKQIKDLADKFKDIINELEELWGSPGLKLTRHNNIITPKKGRQRVTRMDFLFKVNNFSESPPIIKRVIMFLCGNPDYSSEFKSKILRKLTYDLTIFNPINEKDRFVEILMAKDLQFLDEVLWNCKNDAFLRFYEYSAASDLVIQKFYTFLDKKKLISQVNLSEDRAELELNSLILEFCFKNRLRTIIDFITDKKQHVLLLPSLLVQSFSSGIYEHLKRHLKNKRVLSTLANFNVIIEIFKLTSNYHTFLDFLCFLYAMKDVDFSPDVQKFLYEQFKKFLSDTRQISQVIYHMNPLMIFVALSQFFYRLSKKCDNFHYAFVNFASMMMKKCKDFIENYSDFDHLQTLVSNAYSPLDKSVLDMIFEDTDFFFSFFEEKRLSTIVRHNLDNSILYDFNLFEKSSIFKTLTENVDIAYCPEKTKNITASDVLNFELKEQNLGDFKHMVEEKPKNTLNIFACIPNVLDMNEIYKETVLKNHFYQRKVFFSAISLRILLDFIFFFGLFIYILVFTQNYTNTNYFFQNVNADYLNLNSGNSLTDPDLNTLLQQGLASSYSETVYQELISQRYPRNIGCVKELYSKSHSVEIVDAMMTYCIEFSESVENYITLNARLQILFIIIIVMSGDLFIRKGYQFLVLKLRVITALDVFELLNFVVCFVILLLYRSLESIDIIVKDKNFKDTVNKFQLLLNVMSIFFALFLFLYWMKITQYVKFWKKFGFIIKTIELMVQATSIFMFVYFIQIAAFCSVLYVIYSNNSNFSTFMAGLRNLFGFSLGQFTFVDDTSVLFDVLISLIIIVFLVISNIVMLNLLIAILSNVFNKLVSRIDLEISYNYYLLHKEYFFDEKYGNLTFFPRTFNFFLLPVHLLALGLAKPRLTLFFVDFYFTIFFIYTLLFYLICNILLVPLTWLKFLWLMIMNRYYDLCEHKKVPLSVRLFHMFAWFFGGIFYLIGVIFIVDVPIFVKSAYNEIVMPQKPMIQFQRLMQKFICNYMEKELDKQEEYLPEERVEKVKHKAFKANLQSKLQKSGSNQIEARNKKPTKMMLDQQRKNQKRLERICGGIEFDEAVKIFNFQEELEDEKSSTRVRK